MTQAIASLEQIESMFGTLTAAHPALKSLKAAGLPCTLDNIHALKIMGVSERTIESLKSGPAYTGGRRAFGLL